MLTTLTKRYVRAIASGVASVKPSSPVRSAQKEKPASMAIAPAARLMKPEPRYVTTTPSAMAAIVAPVPRPSRRKRRVSFTSSPVGQPTGPESTGPVGWRLLLSGALLGRPDPAGRLRELELPLVGERLEHVVADARRGLVLAALELRRPERQRAAERLRAREDRLGCDPRLARVGLVEEPDRRQHLAE